MKISKAILGAAICALAATSCIKGSYHNSYTAYCTFESSDTTSSNKFFDGVFKSSDFYMGDGALAFCGKRTDDGEFRGGLMVGIRKDFRLEEDYIPKSLYTVVDSTGGASNSIGTCSLAALFVNNTSYVAHAVKYGLPGGIQAFKQGDKLTFKVTGYANGAVTGTATIDLAKYDGNGLSLITKWEKMDVSKIGQFEFLDFSLETNRLDIPQMCCIDNLVASVSIDS